MKIVKFIDKIHTYYAVHNNSHKNIYAIKVFTTKYNAKFKLVDNLCRLIGQIYLLTIKNTLRILELYTQNFIKTFHCLDNQFVWIQIQNLLMKTTIYLQCLSGDIHRQLC